MKNKSFFAVVVGGVVGTAAMSLLVVMAPLMGISMGGPWKMLSTFMGVPVFLGWVMHFMIGVVLAGIYGFFLARFLPGGRVVRGAIYGLIPWLMAMLIVVPMMGGPVFMGSFAQAFGSLMGHLLYGGVMGLFFPVERTS
jgi:uncharacterized membrane protein YagU involved in acid resistance